MRDDVRRNLKQMEEQLLMEASLEEEFGDWLKEEDEEEDWLADARELIADNPGKSRMFDFDAEEEEDEDTTVYAPQKKKKTKAAKKPKKTKPKKEKGVGGLVFLACLELIGIGAVVVWWLLWLL